MTATIRPPTADDRPAVERLVAHAFFDDLGRTLDPDRIRPDDDRSLVAEVDGALVGHVAVWPLGHWLGGGRVPTGGVAAMAVDPAVRGRGVGRDLLRAALGAMADRGEALATLYPLTRGVYRRLGWEIAGERPTWRIATDALARLDADPTVALSPGTAGDVPELARLEARLAPGEQGMLARPERFARRPLAGNPDDATYLARRDGELVGYVVYAHAPSPAPDAMFELRVRELVAADGGAQRTLLRLLGAHVSGAHAVETVGPPVPLLELELPERALQPTPVTWRWMTRVVDAPAAVAARGWPDGIDVRVDLDLTDHELDANHGRWQLEVSGGEGRLVPGGRGTVGLDVATLAPLLTGWAGPRRLARAGRLHGADDGDLAGLERALAGPTPWIRDFF